MQDAADGLARGIPPVFGTLFGPERLLHAHVFMRGGYGVANDAGFVDEERAGAAGADVDAEPIGHGVECSAEGRAGDTEFGGSGWTRTCGQSSRSQGLA